MQKTVIVRRTCLIVILLFMAMSLFRCQGYEKQKLSKEKLLQLAEKCNAAGKEYYKEFQRTMHDPDYIWGEPEYHYNSRMNTCLIHLHYIIIDNQYDFSIHNNRVVDVFANKVILNGYFERDGKNKKETLLPCVNDAPNYTSFEYYKQKDKLFSE